ncbi:MAG: hypothetical protein GWN67_25050 [Phycisphaerae bacterium]|nr:hypothetical protein [Phycisphaerae bacterium]NIP55403.1 hypothetical protein [Phycisphaerae bacterium]NIS54073.1 hypothetical protein [Phycisphaerae bacterium]NIU11716.1 hypothetical protein [Phycisphaerae bacterium]NIU59531.1 hypothetical protein [Phycisphaerae bacterium]
MNKMTFSLIAIILLFGVSLKADAKNTDAKRRKQNAHCIKPYRKNPRYWQYKGEPVLLLGASKTDHIFLLTDLKEHLDEIAAVGGNYVRNTMSQREGLDLKAHKRLENGKFDLTQWNPTYWNRFSNCLKWCSEKDIIIQIEVWDRFDFSQEHWQNSPWRPTNNVNYTPEQSGLANNYPVPPWRDKQPFFHSIPGMRLYSKQYDLIRQFQEKFVTRMLSYSLKYPNVLYCMNNETSTPQQWGQYWMNFIKKAAADKGVEVYVTDMFDDVWKPQSSDKLKQAFDNPQLYPFIDISQVNSRTFNEDHWINLMWIMDRAKKHPRPLNNTKIYSAGRTKWGSGTPKDGVERFWRNLIAGSASCRFHRPGGGIGLNDTAKACILSARKVESLVRFWQVSPRMDLLSNREDDEAYLAAEPHKKYVLFFTDGGSVGLNLKGAKNSFQLSWIDIRTGNRANKKPITGGKVVTINAPDKGPWVAAIVRQ